MVPFFLFLFLLHADPFILSPVHRFLPLLPLMIDFSHHHHHFKLHPPARSPFLFFSFPLLTLFHRSILAAFLTAVLGLGPCGCHCFRWPSFGRSQLQMSWCLISSGNGSRELILRQLKFLSSGRPCCCFTIFSWSFSLLHSEPHQHHQLLSHLHRRLSFFSSFLWWLFEPLLHHLQLVILVAAQRTSPTPLLPQADLSLLPSSFLVASWSRCSCCVLLLAPSEAIEGLVFISTEPWQSLSPAFPPSADSEKLTVGATFCLPISVSLEIG